VAYVAGKCLHCCAIFIVLRVTDIWPLKVISGLLGHPVYIFCMQCIFQNGNLLNVNGVDKKLVDLSIPLELLTKIYLTRCFNEFESNCVTPGGIVTDFNVWDKEMDEKQLKSWTTCQ
jgi:hypothetical protein